MESLQQKSIRLLYLITMDSTISELSDALKISDREKLLNLLKNMRWIDWVDFLKSNSDQIVHYVLCTKKERILLSKKLADDFLLVHHCAMFIVGLRIVASHKGFLPEPSIGKLERHAHELEFFCSVIRLWEDLNMQIENRLFWLFDEPEEVSSFPFKD